MPKVDLIDESTPSLEARSCPSRSRNVVVATVKVRPRNARYEWNPRRRRLLAANPNGPINTPQAPILQTINHVCHLNNPIIVRCDNQCLALLLSQLCKKTNDFQPSPLVKIPSGLVS